MTDLQNHLFSHYSTAKTTSILESLYRLKLSILYHKTTLQAIPIDILIQDGLIEFLKYTFLREELCIKTNFRQELLRNILNEISVVDLLETVLDSLELSKQEHVSSVIVRFFINIPSLEKKLRINYNPV